MTSHRYLGNGKQLWGKGLGNLDLKSEGEWGRWDEMTQNWSLINFWRTNGCGDLHNRSNEAIISSFFTLKIDRAKWAALGILNHKDM